MIVVVAQLGCDLIRFLVLLLRWQGSLVAENMALAASAEVCVRCHPSRRHLPDSRKVTLVLLDRLFGVRDRMLLISPRTMQRWAGHVSTLSFWLRRSRGGRPTTAPDTIAAIRLAAEQNPTWSVRTIANTLSTQLGIRVRHNTVRKYLPLGDPRRRRRFAIPSSQKWSTFIRNHSQQILAMDFAVDKTLFGRILYVLVVMEIGSRRILHTNVTAHPTAEWTAQQLRAAIPAEHPYTHFVHDNDAIFSRAVDATIRSFGIEPLRTPLRSPRANAFCERLIGTLRRGCLDWIVPLGESHLRSLVRAWAVHYNRARPHMALGLTVPEPNELYPAERLPHRHRLPAGSRIVSTPVLGGLHHEYRLEQLAA